MLSRVYLQDSRKIDLCMAAPCNGTQDEVCCGCSHLLVVVCVVFRRLRMHTKWSKHQTDVVVRYFTEWIETEHPGLPRKSDILQFLDRHGDVVDFDWKVVRNKVLNEKAAFDKRKKSVLKKLSVSSANCDIVALTDVSRFMTVPSDHVAGSCNPANSS